MPQDICDDLRETYAMMMAMKLKAEALFSRLGLAPGMSVDIGEFRVTVPACGQRLKPFIEEVSGKSAAA